MTDGRLILSALHFAAHKHRDQRRKGAESSPYINHPIAVAEVLSRIGGIDDPIVLMAAILHDTIEDTDTTAEELEQHFGPVVRKLVEEVTMDMSLPQAERKRWQVEHTPHLSHHAKLIKLGDKSCNVFDVTHNPPTDWSAQRRLEYLDWSTQVVAGCRGTNEALERYFDGLLEDSSTRILG